MARGTRSRPGSALRIAAAIGVCLAALAGTWARSDDAASKNNQGNKLYEQKRYDEALKMYTDAQASLPNSSELHYNIGNVLYRKGEYEKAIEEYIRAQSAGNGTLSQASHFNRGNALMMSGKIQDAVRSYVQALRGNPQDQDAKRNLELALKLLEQQKKQQQQQNQSQQQDQSKEPPPPQPKQGKEEQKKDEPQKRAGQMSEDEARQILEALRESEKEGVKKHAQASAPHTRIPEKDW